MATTPIPKGTCNFPLNITVEERALLGRAAFEAQVSMGEFVKRMLVHGLRQVRPVLADEVEAIREARRRDVARWNFNVIAVVVCGGLLFVASINRIEARRGCGNSARVNRCVRGEESVEA